MKKIVLSFVLFIVSTLSQAVDLEYKGFYQRLKLIEDNQLNEITMAFYLVDSYHRTRCEINKATMLSKSNDNGDIQIGKEGQLMVPFSTSLYDDFALLRVDLKDQRQNCILQMQMQVKDKTKRKFSFADLALITSQMQELVDEFGGLLSFMMPNVQGLSLALANETDVVFINQALKSALNCQKDKCQLSVDVENESAANALIFEQAPVVISPWIQKD